MSIYDYKIKTRKDGDKSMADYRGKVLLIVNTATGCGFTPQYKGLEELYEKYHEKGLEILDFPCDQFGHQAPGTDEEIHEFCTGKYKTQFDQLAKIEVNGDKEDPLFTFIKHEMPKDEAGGMGGSLKMKAISKIAKAALKPEDIKWNFTKFLVDRNGKVVNRYAPTYEPEKIESAIVELLNAEA